jgi:hypothetical protein
MPTTFKTIGHTTLYIEFQLQCGTTTRFLSNNFVFSGVMLIASNVQNIKILHELNWVFLSVFKNAVGVPLFTCHTLDESGMSATLPP